MPQVIREVGVVSVGKTFGIIYAGLGLLIGAIVAVISVFGGFAGMANHGGAAAGIAAIFVGAGAVFVLPIFYGVLGGLMGMFVALIYNVAARTVGGIEITIDNIATLYFVDNFQLGLKEAGLIAGLFGMMNIFARALGGIFGDKAGKKFGLKGRIFILGVFLLCEGLGIMLFSQMASLSWAIAAMLLFALFLKMSNGATYSVVPFINKKAVGSVAGIVGAGGNVGAVLAGFLFKSSEISYRESLFIIGIAVSVVSVISLVLSLSKKTTGELLTPEPGREPALKEALVYAEKV